MKIINVSCRETQKACLVTKAFCNKDFSGNSITLPRSNFGASRQESSPQSLTAYSLNRYGQGFKKRNN